MDPSQVYRPELANGDKEQWLKGIDTAGIQFDVGRDKTHFRQHEQSSVTSKEHMETVRRNYKLMHTYQTVDFVKQKRAEYGKMEKGEHTIMEALDMTNSVIDETDPDMSIPNIFHAYQTAERIREIHPDKDWFHLVGLIHDLGKIMVTHGEPHWCVGGDTYPVGCAFADSIVYRDTSFNDNPDLHNPQYNTKLGIYKENCGLDNVLISWGHDEYLYQVLIANGCTLPEEGLWMIRYHSLYPWHTGGDYTYLCNNKDVEMLRWIREFSKFDLYSKGDVLPDIDALRPYYQSLIDKYVPGKIKF
ncbi:inositol oxygenase-like [Amphiura filiformis]|uniref:inositol oxygenase-like n=1 Tax=Amphiura filiformis TaxID=82378 RepID=UPI003B21C9E0